MAQQHTPGPWQAEPSPHDDGAYLVYRGDGEYLTLDEDEHEANARLIAAAPDLLAALIAFVDGDAPDTLDDRYENARAAIARAGAA